MMKRLTALLLAALLAFIPSIASERGEGASAEESAQKASTQEEEGSFNVKEYIFGHIQDSHEWHITTINGRHVTIFLPVIVHSGTTGWHVFLSDKLEEGYEGLSLNADGKIVETLPDGSQAKVLDISITKNVLGLMVNCLILLILILCTSRWYRRHDVLKESPKGFTGLMEMLIMMVTDDIIKEGVGKDYEKYAPYLLTAFFFIFINNLMGIVPFFPGGANITGNIAVTLALAVCTFLAVNLFGNKHYYKDIFWPEVPSWLKVPIPLMPLIEIIGMFTKPFSLMVRLFANILAGHIMLLGVIAVIFLTAKLGPALNGSMTVISVLFGVFMDVLELLVAFLQAYVFTMLSSVFIGLSRQEPEAEKDETIITTK